MLLGATSPAQLEENLSALDVVPKLTTEVMGRIATIAERAVPAQGKVEKQVHGVRTVDAIAGPHVARPSWAQ